MILKRIREIKNVSQFFKAGMNAPIDKDFTKVSLIYGPNGFGKSTLSDIFYSLKYNDGAVVFGKKTIPDRGDPACYFSFASNFTGSGGEIPVKLDGSTWTNPQNNLEIFDCRFISQNVYSDFEITHEHKKRISALILGDDGVLIARQIESIQKSVEESKRELRLAGEKIKSIIPFKYNTTVELFSAMETGEKTKTAKKDSLKSKLKGVVETEKVKILYEPETIPFICKLVSEEFPELEKNLKLSTKNISASAAEKVEKHILNHLDHSGEKWLRQGLAYHNGEVCPFCSQDTKPVKGLIDAYSDFFSKEYETFVDSVVNNIELSNKKINSSFQTFERVPSMFDRNNERIIKTKEYIDKIEYEAIVNPLEDCEKQIRADVQELHTQAKKILEDLGPKINDKKQNPLKSLTTKTIDYTELVKLENDVNKGIFTYNKTIEVITSKIENIKKSTATDKQSDIETQLIEIDAIEARFSRNGEDFVNDYLTKVEDLKKLEESKTKKEAELITHNKSVAGKYLKEANDVLKESGCRFIIRAPEDFSRRGHQPVIDLGFTLSGVEMDGKKFGDILSESDKRCLAFALFVAKLQSDNKISEKIIILDDPFTSLDDHRQDNTILQIKKLANKAAQVLVMCHYSQPMSELANDFKGSLQLEIVNSNTSGSIFAEKNFAKLRNNKHLLRLDSLQDVLDNNVETTKFPIVRANIRTVIEHEILSRFRPYFKNSKANTLGEIITEFESQAKKGLIKLKDDPDNIIITLRHINDRTAQEHHADPDAEDKADSIDNLRNTIRTAQNVIYEKL